jgi:diaminopimelate decarboxylase
MNTIANYDIKSIAEEFGTPVYTYDAEQIRYNYNRLKNAFQKFYPKTHVHFSVKANSNVEVLKVLKDIGGGADCSSPIEFLLTQKAGFSDDKILYTGNYESPTDFEVLKGHDIKINLDDITSLDRLVSVKKPSVISFRINPGIGRGGHEGITTAGTDAKFGVPYEKAYEAYKKAIDMGFTRFGIHMMTGSNNLEPYYFAEVVEKLMKFTGNIFNDLGIKPEYVDIGGGFGVPYEDFEDELNVELAAKLVSEEFREKCEKFNFGEPELILEPGRYIAANSGYLISKVTGIKQTYKTFVGLDAGMNTLLRPALYGAKHRVSVYGKEGKDLTANLCGQICENSDIFAQNLFLPNVEVDDLVVFREAGAYGFVMSSNYNNRLRSAEVLIDKGKARLIRRRETLEDIMKYYE